jgi:uncharacterized protein YggU (UPF0235/DUF167 family)
MATHDLFAPDPSAPEGETAVIVRVRLRPGAGQTKLTGRDGAAFGIQVAAPYGSPRANSACTELLATILGVEGSAVTVASGEGSREKRLRAVVAADADVARRIEAALDDARSANRTGDGRRGR